MASFTDTSGHTEMWLVSLILMVTVMWQVSLILLVTEMWQVSLILLVNMWQVSLILLVNMWQVSLILLVAVIWQVFTDISCESNVASFFENTGDYNVAKFATKCGNFHSLQVTVMWQISIQNVASFDDKSGDLLCRKFS